MRAPVLLVFIGLRAYAQEVGTLAQGLATQPLAYIAAGGIFVAGFLGRALLAEKDARLAQALDHAKALADARAEGTLLAKQLGDGLDALEKVMDHVTRS